MRPRGTLPALVWLALVLTLAAALPAACVALGATVGVFLASSDRSAPSDATLLTYSVDSFARPQARRLALDAAIARYRSGETARVLLGVLVLPAADGEEDAYRTNVELARRTLVRGGVPDAAIETLSPVDDERGEALALQRAAQGQGWRRVQAYAPDFRARRTRAALTRALAPVGIEVRVIGTPTAGLEPDRWWMSGRGRRMVPEEAVKLAYYVLRGWASL